MSLPIPKPPMFDGNPPPYDPKADLAERCAKAEAELERVTADRDNETKWAKQYHDDWVKVRDELERVQKREAAMREALTTLQIAAAEDRANGDDMGARWVWKIAQAALQPDAGSDFVPRAELEACQKREPASALRHCARCGAPIAPIEDDNGLCVKCSLNPRPAKTAAGVVYSELKRQRDTLQDMLLQVTKQCDELKAKLAENEEARELLENERKLSAEFRRRLETVERMLKDSEACLADARAELERVQKQAEAMRWLLEKYQSAYNGDEAQDYQDAKWLHDRIEGVLAADAGSDYIRRDQVKPLVEALRQIGTDDRYPHPTVLKAIEHTKSLGL